MLTWYARYRSTTGWGRSGSSLSMVSPLPPLMTWSGTNAVIRRKQSWAQLMSSPRASALTPVISRAGRPAPSRCSESWDSPSIRDDQPGKADPHVGMPKKFRHRRQGVTHAQSWPVPESGCRDGGARDARKRCWRGAGARWLGRWIELEQGDRPPAVREGEGGRRAAAPDLSGGRRGGARSDAGAGRGAGRGGRKRLRRRGHRVDER